MKTISLFAVLALLAGSGASASEAKAKRSQAGVEMPERVTVGDSTLHLNGIGVHEATPLRLKVLVAGLYLERPTSSAAQILQSRQSKRLHVEFKRSVSRGDLLRAARGSVAGKPRMAAHLETLGRWLGDFRAGDTLSLTHLQGEGVQVTVNGKDKGLIADEDFASTLFAAWLGPEAPSAKLRSDLLGATRSHASPARRR